MGQNILRLLKRGLFFLFSAVFSCHITNGQSYNHTYMWWVNSVKESEPHLFAVETSQFKFVFDYDRLNFTSFSFTNEKLEDELVPQLSFGIETAGVLFPCTQSSGRTEDCQLIHSGRFLQHRYINWIPGLTGCDPHHSGLDIAVYGDRLLLMLQLLPSVNLRANTAVVNFIVPSEYKLSKKSTTSALYKNSRTGNGFVIMKTPESTMLDINGQQVTAKYVSSEKLKAGEKVKLGLIIYPIQQIDRKQDEVVVQESSPVVVKAHQLLPLDTTLKVQYEPDMGWYRIELRNDAVGENFQKDNQRMEQVVFSVENTDDIEKRVRLNFSKEKEVFGITGISAIIRDMEGFPTGIPVQLSKNWHTVDFNQYDAHRYRGPWYHGITELVIPPKSTVKYEYVSVNAFWGNIPAVSHAQLCLVGWGQNQQWDQSAMGAWGESVCYEPDLDQAGAPVLDIRPLYVVSPQGDKGKWTGNVGGADFFNLTKEDGRRAWHTSVKTEYKRNCPNLTEVVYSGHMLNHKIDFSYVTTIFRSDDYLRGIYKLRMDVNEKVVFNRLDLIQMAAATYHYSFSRHLATGNKKGLLQEWEALNAPDKEMDYFGKLTACSGQMPWFSFSDSQLSPEQQGHFKGGNRGMILRKWNAKINGQENMPPYWQELPSVTGTHGPKSSIISITLSEDCHSLQQGDFIEAEIELLVFPVERKDYYGTDFQFAQYLENREPWELVWRESVNNDLEINGIKGDVLHSYPIVIKSECDTAVFSVKGGIGYLPLTITGLSHYKRPVLLEKTGGDWKPIVQESYGNDYWQVDTNIDSTYQITYNIKSGDKSMKRRYFKFILTE